jgi:hypothetical protein
MFKLFVFLIFFSLSIFGPGGYPACLDFGDLQEIVRIYSYRSCASNCYLRYYCFISFTKAVFEMMTGTCHERRSEGMLKRI